MSDGYVFLSGAVAAAFVVAGLFFLRFWKRTRDGLFVAFALAFWLLGLTQALLALSDIPVEDRRPASPPPAPTKSAVRGPSRGR